MQLHEKQVFRSFLNLGWPDGLQQILLCQKGTVKMVKTKEEK